MTDITDAELSWLLEEFEMLSASDEGERAVGEKERAEYELNRQRAKEIIGRVRLLVHDAGLAASGG